MLKKKLLLLMVLVLLLPIVAMAAETIKPELLGIAFPDHEKTLYPGGTIIMQLKIHDDSNIGKVYVEFKHEEDEFYLKTNRATYNRATGVYTLTGTIPPNVTLGEYKLYSILIRDEFENGGDYSSKVKPLTFKVEKSPIPTSRPYATIRVLPNVDQFNKIPYPIAVLRGYGNDKRYLQIRTYNAKEIVAYTCTTYGAEDLEYEAERTVAYHFKMVDRKSQEISTAGLKTKVYLPYPQGYSMKSDVKWTLKRYNENFTKFVEVPVNADKRGLWFETEQFGPYVLNWQGLPDTGDETPIALLLALMTASLGAMVLILRRRKEAK